MCVLYYTIFTHTRMYRSHSSHKQISVIWSRRRKVHPIQHHTHAHSHTYTHNHPRRHLSSRERRANFVNRKSLKHTHKTQRETHTYTQNNPSIHFLPRALKNVVVFLSFLFPFLLQLNILYILSVFVCMCVCCIFLAFFHPFLSLATV